MSDKKMPAAEVEVVDVSNYELAFHVLPTVAEGEVSTVFQTLKDIITKVDGQLTVEEAPERFDLAYEIIQYLEGRNRKFTSAYFGWVRFTLAPEQIALIEEELEGVKELMRHILVKLTKSEEAHPFYFHEALEEVNPKSIDVDAELADKAETDEAEAKTDEAADDSKDDGEADEEKV